MLGAFAHLFTVTCMTQPSNTPNILDLFPEETREAADLLTADVQWLIKNLP